MRRVDRQSLVRVIAVIAMTAAAMALPGRAPRADAQQLQQLPDITISEILATNQGAITGITDADGDSPDFIEIHNGSGAAVDIGRWALVDGDDIWEFPSAQTIAPNERLVVWASGKNVTMGAQLHTNFKLRERGEYLALFDDESTLVDLAGDGYPMQVPNVSWGHGPDGSNVYFAEPTPGQPNTTTAYAGVVAAPEAENGRGFYDAALSETLSTETPAAHIHYTLDGTLPTQASPRFDGSLQILPDATGVVTVRARAFRAGYAPSVEASWSYVFPTSLYAGLPGQGISSLPVFVLNTDDQQYPTETTKRRVALEMVETDSERDGFAITAGVKEFGESSVGFEKSNFRLFFDSDFGVSELDYPVFDGYGQGIIDPATRFDKLELRGGSWDSWQAAASGRFSPSDYYITDRFIRDTRLDMGSLATHGRFVNVFVNGDYRGFYQLRERFDHAFFASYADDGEEPETIEALKLNEGSYSNNGDQNVNGDSAVFDSLTKNWQQDEQWVSGSDLVDFTLLMSLNESDFEKEFRGVGSMVAGSPNDYIFLYNDNDMRLRSLKSILSHNMGYSPGFFVPALVPHFNSYRSDPEFMQIVHERAARALCSGGALTTEKMLERFDYWRAEIQLAMRSEDRRWEGQRSIDYYGSHYVEHKYESWDTNMSGLRQRISSMTDDLRTAWQSEGLLDGCDLRPVVRVDDQRSALGRQVSLTIDASDPDGDAMTFTANGLPPGLSINAATGAVTGTPSAAGTYDVTLRVTDSNGKWTPVDIQWAVAGGPDLIGAVVINEIMYHPGDDAAPLPIDPDLGSFIEIRNATDQTIDIGGLQFADGVEYRVPDATSLGPQEYFVVAESAAAFRRIHGFLPDGDYEGGLSNAGETIAIADQFDQLLDTVTFDDEGPWAEAADGQGASLSLIDPDLDNALAESWSASSQPNGTPGAINVLFEMGDVNGSNSVDRADVTALLAYLTRTEPDVFHVGVADVNGDGSVTLVDALVLARSLG